MECEFTPSGWQAGGGYEMKGHGITLDLGCAFYADLALMGLASVFFAQYEGVIFFAHLGSFQKTHAEQNDVVGRIGNNHSTCDVV